MTEQKDALSAALVAALQAARAVGRLQIMCGDGEASDAELNDAEHAEDYARAAVERLARQAAPPTAAPDGWVLVPREPTDAMTDAAYAECRRFGVYDCAVHLWDAMLAAAPPAPAAPAEAQPVAEWLRAEKPTL